MKYAVSLALIALHTFQLHSASKNVIEDRHDQLIELLSTRDYKKVLEMSKGVLEASKLEGYTWGEAHSCFIMAFSHEQLGELADALVLYLEAMRIFDESIPLSDHVEEKTSIFLNVGRIYRAYSNYDQCQKFYDEGLKLARDNDLTALEIKLLYNKGTAYKYESKYVEAAKFLHGALDRSLIERNYLWYYNSLNQLGAINYRMDRFDEARKHYSEAIQIVDKLDNPPKYKGRILHNLANTYFEEGDLKKARKCYEEAIENKLRAGVKTDLFLTYQSLSELCNDMQEFESGRAYGLKALEYYHLQKPNEEIIAIYDLLSKVNFSLKNYEEAQSYSTLFSNEIKKFLGDREYSKQLEDAYQIDLLTKQYYLNQEKREQQAKIKYVVVLCSIVVAIVLIFFFISRHIRKSQKRLAEAELREIFASTAHLFDLKTD